MKPKITLVYQDCPSCGVHEAWYNRQMTIAESAGIEIVKVSFVIPGIAEIIREANKKGVKSCPFFTDGKKFSKNLADFIEKTPEPAMKTKKKSTKRKKSTKKELSNGAGTEN